MHGPRRRGRGVNLADGGLRHSRDPDPGPTSTAQLAADSHSGDCRLSMVSAV